MLSNSLTLSSLHVLAIHLCKSLVAPIVIQQVSKTQVSTVLDELTWHAGKLALFDLMYSYMELILWGIQVYLKNSRLPQGGTRRLATISASCLEVAVDSWREPPLTPLRSAPPSGSGGRTVHGRAPAGGEPEERAHHRPARAHPSHGQLGDGAPAVGEPPRLRDVGGEPLVPEPARQAALREPHRLRALQAVEAAQGAHGHHPRRLLQAEDPGACVDGRGLGRAGGGGGHWWFMYLCDWLVCRDLVSFVRVFVWLSPKIVWRVAVYFFFTRSV